EDPVLAASSVAGLWLVGRAAIHGAARARRRRVIALAARSSERPSLGSSEVEALAASRSPLEVAAIVDRVFAAAAPGTMVELWRLGSRREWRRARGGVIPCAPASDELLRFFRETAGGSLDRDALAGADQP